MQVDELRPYAELEPDHRKVLDFLWKYHAAKGEWPREPRIRHDAHVGGSSIRRMEELGLLAHSTDGRHRPSVVGLLYLDREPAAVTVLDRLEALWSLNRDRYDPELNEPLSDAEVAGALGCETTGLALLEPFADDIDLRFHRTKDGTLTFHVQEPRHDSFGGVLQVLARAPLDRYAVPSSEKGALEQTPGLLQVRITGLDVAGFRALRRIELRFPSTLTVLMGPNGVGKSTVLDALAFIGTAARSGLEAALSDEGGLASVQTAGADAPLQMGVHFRLDPGLGQRIGRYVFEVIGQYGETVVDREQLVEDRDGESIVHLSARRADMKLSGRDGMVHGYKPIGELALIAADRSHTIVGPVRQDLGRVVLVDRDPLLARQRKGHDLVRVAGAVAERHRGRWRQALPLDKILAKAAAADESTARVGEALRSFVPHVLGVERVVHTGKPSELVVREKGIDRALRIDELSAGMRQLLVLAALAAIPAPPALVLLEEPDSGLHVGALPALRDLLRSLARRSVVIATSHSPAFAALLDPEREVMALSRGEDGTRAMSLAEARRERRWLDQLTQPYESLVRGAMERDP